MVYFLTSKNSRLFFSNLCFSDICIICMVSKAMADFDLIETDFNIADETVNFGNRCIAEGDNLHQTRTLVSLKCSEQTSSIAYVKCAIKNGHIYCSINKSIKVFKDKECSDILFSAGFDDIINSFSLTPNGDFLLICLQSGVFHLVQCGEEYQFVQTRSITCDLSLVATKINSFTLEDNENPVSFLIVTSDGQVLKLVYNEAEGLSINTIHEFKFSISYSALSKSFLLVNGLKMAILNLDTGKWKIDDEPLDLKVLAAVDNMFLGIDSFGNFLRICAATLLVFPQDSDSFEYKDIILCSNENNQISEAFVVRKCNKQERIALLSYPDFFVKYSLPVTDEVCLIPPESINDELLFFSKTYENDLLTTLRLLCVYETDPEQRLERLLKKRQYEEAERFAKNFDLDPTLIIKAKAKIIIEKPVCSSEDVVNLIDLLDAIKDDDKFKLDACTLVEEYCEKTEDVKKILLYGCRLQLKARQADEKIDLEERQKIMADNLFRFETFHMLYKNTKYDTMEMRNTFSKCDLITELKSCLRKHKIEEATIIYTRLENFSTLTLDVINEILFILNSIDVDLYKLFLPNFITITLENLPDAFPLIIKWIYNKIIYFEQNCSDNFPHNAIKFANYVISLIKAQQNAVNLDNTITPLRSISELAPILSTMEDIKCLKMNYNINISVSTFLKGPQTVIRALLNMTLSSEKYEVFINEFLLGYIHKNHLEADDIFEQEIREILKFPEKYWISVVGAVLNCISCTEIKLTSIKEILTQAVVPWSNEIKKLANDALNYFDPLVDDIKKLISDEPLLIVLKKPKYKIKNKRFTSLSELRNIVRRIICCNDEDMVQDCYKLVSPNIAKSREEITYLLVRNFIVKGDFEKALELIDAQPSNEKYNCFNRIGLEIEEQVNNRILVKMPEFEQIRKNFIEMRSFIFFRLIGLEPDLQDIFQERLNQIQNVYKLERILKIKTTTETILEQASKQTQEFVESISTKYKLNEITLEDVLNQSKTFADLLLLDRSDVLVDICNNCKDFNMIYSVGEEIFNSEINPKNFCLISVLILKYVGTSATQVVSVSDIESSFDVNEDIEPETNVFHQGLKLARKLMWKALSLDIQFTKCSEVFKWTEAIFYCISELNGGAISLVTFNTIQKIFDMFCRFISSFNLSEMEYLTHFNEENLSVEGLTSELKQLFCFTDDKFDEKHQLTVYYMIKTMRNLFLCLLNDKETKILNVLNKILHKHCIPKIQQLILNNDEIDSEFLCHLLVESNDKNAMDFIWHYLRKYRRQPDKFHPLLITGQMFMDHTKNEANKTALIDSIITLKWWNKVKHNNNLNYDMFFKLKADKRFDLLIDVGCMEFEMIEDFCKDFKLNVNSCNTVYFKRLLIDWKPNYEIQTDSQGTRFVVVKNDAEALLAKCEKIMTVMDKSHVFEIINILWKLVNFYYYEIFITILSILKQINPQEDNERKQLMLNFLIHYKRVSKPNDREIEQWFSLFPDTQSVDELSEFRLPFTPTLFTSRIIDIIRPEINLKTYRKWFDILHFNKDCLQKNEICSYAIKQLVASGVLARSNSDEWLLYPKLDDILAEVEECVENISSTELATSVVYHLMINIPPGADKVNAAKIAYKYAKFYMKDDPKSAAESYQKIEKKYYAISAVHILHEYKLAEEKYIDLVAQPKTLITTLYNDERIIQKIDLDNIACPDISKAVEELAKLFSLDIRKIRLSLINNFIAHYQTSETDMDVSVLVSDEVSSDNNLKRASYICCNSDSKILIQYLYEFAASAEFTEARSVIARANAMKLLIMILEPAQIKTMADSTMAEFKDFEQKLLIMHNLELINIDLTIESLNAFNKKQLVNRLIEIKSPISIKTMAMILTTYNIEDIHYWKYVLQRAVKYSLFEELKMYLKYLVNFKYQYKGFYVEAWQHLIDHYFKSLSCINGSELRKDLVKKFLIIQSCPVIYSLNFKNAFMKCMELKMFTFAAILLQYFESPLKAEFVEEICQKNITSSALDELTEEGICGIRIVKTILFN